VGKLIYRVLGVALAIPTTILTRKVLTVAWQHAQGDTVTDPKAPNARLNDVLAWAGLSAVSVAVGQFVASRGAAVVYRALTGRPAPGWAPEPEPER